MYKIESKRENNSRLFINKIEKKNNNKEKYLRITLTTYNKINLDVSSTV